MPMPSRTLRHQQQHRDADTGADAGKHVTTAVMLMPSVLKYDSQTFCHLWPHRPISRGHILNHEICNCIPTADFTRYILTP